MSPPTPTWLRLAARMFGADGADGLVRFWNFLQLLCSRCEHGQARGGSEYSPRNRRVGWPAGAKSRNDRHMSVLARKSLLVILVTAALLSICLPALTASADRAKVQPVVLPVITGTTTLSGEVRDGRVLTQEHAPKIVLPSGLPAVGGATVSIAGLRSTKTDTAGRFTLRGLRVSTRSAYTLSVRKKGFGLWRESGIKLIPGTAAHVYVELHSATMNLTAPKMTRHP